MNEKIKNYLGGAIIIAVLVFSYAAVSYVNSYSKVIEPSSFRSFSVSGEGRVVAIPDVAQFTFTVITEGGKDLNALQNQNTKKSDQAIAFVKSKGVDKKDIKTANYSIEPRYQYYDCSRIYPVPGSVDGGKPCPPPEIVGYTVRQTVEVKVRDFEAIGPIVGGVVSEGANQVSTPIFTIDDPTDVQNQAREEAITKAKEKAKAIAKAGSFNVGRLLSIDEGFNGYPRFYGIESLKVADAVGGAPPPGAPTIEPGSQDVTITVTLRYEIE